MQIVEHVVAPGGGNGQHRVEERAALILKHDKRHAAQGNARRVERRHLEYRVVLAIPLAAVENVGWLCPYIKPAIVGTVGHVGDIPVDRAIDRRQLL